MLSLLIRIIGPRRSYRLIKRWWRLTKPITVGVRVIVLRGDTVLLVRHTYRDGWFFPGGGLKRNEPLEQAARREVLEESGVTVTDLELFGVYANFHEAKSDHVIVFLAHATTDPGAHDAEIAEARYFPLDALPPDLYHATARRLIELREGRSNIIGRW